MAVCRTVISRTLPRVAVRVINMFRLPLAALLTFPLPVCLTFLLLAAERQDHKETQAVAEEPVESSTDNLFICLLVL